MNNYEIISKDYYSNCLIEVIKAKFKNPFIKIYLCKPKRGTMFHFMWEDSSHSYDFSDMVEVRHEHFWQYFIFKGHIRKFRKGFAKDYTYNRNNKGDFSGP